MLPSRRNTGRCAADETPKTPNEEKWQNGPQKEGKPALGVRDTGRDSCLCSLSGGLVCCAGIDVYGLDTRVLEGRTSTSKMFVLGALGGLTAAAGASTVKQELKLRPISSCRSYHSEQLFVDKFLRTLWWWKYKKNYVWSRYTAVV